MSRVWRDDVFAALADEHRRLILDRLRQRNGQTLTELCEGQKITRQAVTKHLRTLEEANLVLSKRQGRKRLHSGVAFPDPVYSVERAGSRVGRHRLSIPSDSATSRIAL